MMCSKAVESPPSVKRTSLAVSAVSCATSSCERRDIDSAVWTSTEPSGLKSMHLCPSTGNTRQPEESLIGLEWNSYRAEAGPRRGGSERTRPTTLGVVGGRLQPALGSWELGICLLVCRHLRHLLEEFLGAL